MSTGYVKKLQSNGRKAWYMGDSVEDRTVPYKKYEITRDIDGFCMDIDQIKWRYIGGKYVPFAIIELTSTGSDSRVSESYLKAIEKRIWITDRQAVVIETLAKLLNVPAYWVLFPTDMSWIYAYSLQRKEWRFFNEADKWFDFIRTK